MKSHIILIAGYLLLLTSCGETPEPAKEVKNEIHVKVYDTTTWSESEPELKAVSGVSVSLIPISDSKKLAASTNSEGIAVFEKVKAGDYNLTATKGDLSTLYDITTENGIKKGYLIKGVYTSQEDIDHWAHYANARVGGLKLYDTNADGIINVDDKITGEYLHYEYNYLDINQDGIIDTKDIVDGNLTKLDNKVEVRIYIGK